jgi:tRNA threonylcarbamoyladenosine biosynthesis protein TsaB
MSNTGFPKRLTDATEDAEGARQAAGGVIVLAVDTATDARSVCVARGAQTLSLIREVQAKAGASVVLGVIDEVLRRAGVRLDELGLFAVACGPGSFTGLRAGLSTVKAFAAMSGRPVAAVPTLHAVALAAGPSERTVAAIPAGRGEVFAQLLRVAESGEVSELNAPVHVSPSELTQAATEWGVSLKWAGGGAAAHVDLIREAAIRAGCVWLGMIDKGQADPAGARNVWAFVPPAESYAEQIASLGLIRWGEGVLLDAREVRADYVRPSDAELK